MSEKKKDSIKKEKEKNTYIGETEKNLGENKKESVDTLKPYEEIHFVDSTKSVWNYSLFTDEHIRNFQNGTHYSLYNFFGLHQREVLGVKGYYFAVWAPNATYVSVKGNFNNWNNESHPLFVRLEKSGIWEGFIPHMAKGEVYKYHIHGFKGAILDKGDPYANFWEKRPNTASITWELATNGMMKSG